MLRKLIMFAITSGLAKKAWDHYRKQPTRTPNPSRPAAAAATPPAGTNRATTAGAGQV